MAQQAPLDFDPGFAPLIKQLTDDSRKLIADEVRLAKLETMEGVHRAGMGALWMGAAIGALIVALVGATLLLATIIGRLAGGHYWIGALVTAVVELAVGYLLLTRGIRQYKAAPYSLPATRDGIRLIKGEQNA